MLAKSGQLPATKIYAKFKVSPPAISQHLKVLKDANLVQIEKKAQQRIYQINPHAMQEIEEWTKKVRDLWSGRFDKLDKALKFEKKKLAKGKH